MPNRSGVGGIGTKSINSYYTRYRADATSYWRFVETVSIMMRFMRSIQWSLYLQVRPVASELISEWGYGERGARAYDGSLEVKLPVGSRAEPLIMASRALPWSWELLVLNRPIERQNLLPSFPSPDQIKQANKKCITSIQSGQPMSVLVITSLSGYVAAVWAASVQSNWPDRETEQSADRQDSRGGY